MTLRTLSSKNKVNTVIIFLLIFFFLINIPIIYQKDIFVDEAITYYITNTVSFKEIFMGIDTHPPVYYLLMKILPHNNIYLLRFYSLIIMTISIGLFYVMSEKFFKDSKMSIYLIILIILSQTISEYGTMARMYPLLFLMSVLIMFSFFKKRYNLTITLICISMFVHYYSIFFLVPFVTSLFYIERKDFKKIMITTFISVFLTLLILSPVVYHQLTDNPYKLTPPNYRVSLTSVLSMLIFPLVIPSNITTIIPYLISFVVIIFIVYLIITFKHKDNNVYFFLLLSFFSTLLLFFLSYFFNIPYHHRYTIMFFPMLYLIYILSFEKENSLVKFIISVIILIFLCMTFISYHEHPKNVFIEISKTIHCPENILHETPFSYLPMSIYLPNCNHYMANSGDWTGLTYKTLYTTPDSINNDNVSYDVYLHYFEEVKMIELLRNSNLTTIRLILVKD